MGGHLVTVKDGAEQAWLVATFGGGSLYWIGFSDIAAEGSWMWVSGEPVTYTNWAGGEPNTPWRRGRRCHESGCAGLLG